MGENLTYADKPWLKSYFVGPFKLSKTMEPYPKIPVTQFLDDAAQQFPDNVACVYLEEEFTYQQLKLQVDKFATALAELGVKKGDTVATILPSCPQFIISDYAIMRLGAIHVPISILHQASDLLHELNESGAETVICSYRRLERVNAIKNKTKLKTIIWAPVPIYPLYSTPDLEEIPGADRFEDLIKTSDPNPPNVEIDPMNDVVLLPFTGGTTGVPKGTMLSHYNLTSNVIQSLHWMMSPLAPGVKGKSAVEICVPIFHQMGHWGVHACISWGLRIILVDGRDLQKIAELIKKYRPFVVMGVPTHYMLLLNEDIPKMPIFFYAGAAALPPDVAKQWEKKIGVPLGEGYGLTEASPCVHLNLSGFSKVTGFMAEVKRSIGVPVADTEVKIVDPETGAEAPLGEAGELWVRGPQIMLGYWPTPCKCLDKYGWLATGDIAKMDEEGYFYIVDRIKDMINVSGMKVYSRIVDDVLFEHPAILEAGVIGVPDPERPGSERIKAFIVLKPEYEGKVTGADIMKYCQENLPPYAIPKFVEFRPILPLTPVMKIHKKQLRDEELAKMRERGEF
ncbi:MAG: AMP-binding protein [Candidatus Heimdallarchaeota archaeon]